MKAAKYIALLLLFSHDIGRLRPKGQGCPSEKTIRKVSKTSSRS